MLVDLEEKQIQLLILATNYYLDDNLYIIDEENKQDEDYKLLSDAQMKLYEAVQRHKKRG
jgi:hypothetical protein